jgi:hypothetical protein
VSIHPDWHLHGQVSHWHEGGRTPHAHQEPVQPMYPPGQVRRTRYSRENTSGRAFWVIWCCLWAGVWLTWATLATAEHTPNGALWLAVVLSVGAIWLPVGKTRRKLLSDDRREIR